MVKEFLFVSFFRSVLLTSHFLSFKFLGRLTEIYCSESMIRSTLLFDVQVFRAQKEEPLTHEFHISVS